jgi:hypothetical protein
MRSSPAAPVESIKSPDEITTLVGSWRRSLAARRASPATIATYTSAVELLASFLVSKGMPATIGGVRREHVEAFSDESYARTHAVRIAGHDWFDHDRIESILQEGRTLSGALVRSHWKGVLSLSQQLARRLRLAGSELDSALAAALRLSPSRRAAEAARDLEWRAIQTFLDREHSRRDLRQRVLATASIHMSSTSSSPSATAFHRPRPLHARRPGAAFEWDDIAAFA